MANDYFNHENPLTRHTLGRAEQVNATFSAIEAAFDKLPTPDQINRGSVAYVLDLGTVNSYVVNFARVPESYTEGMNFTMKAATTNTGASVINVNGLGAKQIRRFDGTPLEAGDIRAGQLVVLGYDGTRFMILGAHGAELAKARQWATSTSVVESGLLGARGYADKADRWANADQDVVVEGGRYSAKHWAMRAESNAGLLPNPDGDIPARTYRDFGTAAEPFRDGRFTRYLHVGARVQNTVDDSALIVAGGTNPNGAHVRLYGPAHASSAGRGELRTGTATRLRWDPDTISLFGDITVTGKITGEVPTSQLSGILPDDRLDGNYSFANLALSGVLSAVGGLCSGANNSRLEIGGGGTPSDGARIRLRGSTESSAPGAGTLIANGVSRLSWDADGVRVSGVLEGNGAGLTNVPAGSLTGIISPARLSGDYSFGSLSLSGNLTTDGMVTSRGNEGAFVGDGTTITIAPGTGDSLGRTIRFRPRGSGTSAGQASLDSLGNLSVAGIITGNGSGLTNVPAGSLTGTINPARLSGDYSFASLTLSGGLTAGGSVTAHGNEGVHYGNGTVVTLAPAAGNESGREIKLRPRGSGTSTGELNGSANGWSIEGNPVATVSQASNSEATVFPIGHQVIARGARGNRNSTVTVRLHPDFTADYSGGGSQSALAGTWRRRGCEPDDAVLAQRVA